VFLLAMLMVGHEEREHIASDTPDGRLDACHLIRPHTGGDRDRPRRDVDSFGILGPLFVGPRDREKLFGVRPRSLPELARQAREAALVLHVKEELGRAIRVGSNDHLLGSVGVTVKLRRSLRPTRMTRVYLEAAAVKWGELMDFV
jgi:hypothetical protein